jgi:heme-degrading monooxygenase HmoA
VIARRLRSESPSGKLVPEAKPLRTRRVQGVIIQIIKFETTLSEEEVLAAANERVEQFRALPGLVQKYYVKLSQPDRYGGVYVWDSKESLAAYRESDLAASIPAAYKVKGAPEVEILDVLFQLRE